MPVETLLQVRQGSAAEWSTAANATVTAVEVITPKCAPITGATISGTTVTYTAVNTFTVGDSVTIAGISGGTNADRFNITGTIATQSSSQFTVAVATTFTATYPGSASGYALSGIGTPVTITNATISGSTITYTGVNTFVVGMPVSIGGITGGTYASRFNVNGTIASRTSGNFTVIVPTSFTATYSSSGGKAVAGAGKLSYTANNAYKVGQKVTVTGIVSSNAPIPAEGSWLNITQATITEVTSTKFTVAATIYDTWTSGGVASINLLSSGEFGFATDIGKVKIGDGSSSWSSLPYMATLAGYQNFIGRTTLVSDIISTTPLIVRGGGATIANSLVVTQIQRVTTSPGTTVTTATPHGFETGQSVYLSETGDIALRFNGLFTVSGTPTATTFTINNVGSAFTIYGGFVTPDVNLADLTSWRTADGGEVAWIDAVGNLSARTKSFNIAHPLDETKRLRHGSLEGPEHAVYIRGILDGDTEILLPDYWSNLVDEDTITVQLTPIGKSQALFVQTTTSEKVTISGPAGIKCYYLVQAERKDIPKIVVEGE
jgi:hypothetical protein